MAQSPSHLGEIGVFYLMMPAGIIRWCEVHDQARSYSFLFRSVAPGAHQVFLEYRSQVNGEAVNIDKFAVEVQHR